MRNINKAFAWLLLFLMCSGELSQAARPPRRHAPAPKVAAQPPARITRANLLQEIEKILNTSGLKNSKFGVSIYSIDKNQFIFQRNSSAPLIPASTTKLFSSFAALSLLGKDYQVRTQVYTDAKKIRESTLDGNLYIVGKGDCLLNINDVEVLADQIRNLGIKRITGAIYGDGSFFDGESSRYQYSGDLDEVEHLPHITSLGLNRNQVTVLVSAGRSGGPVNVQFIPNSTAFEKVNNVTAGGAARKETAAPSKKAKTKRAQPKLKPAKKTSKRNRKGIANNVYEYEIDGTYALATEQMWGDGNGLTLAARKKRRGRSAGRALSVTSRKGEDGKQYFYISGSVPAGVTRSFVFDIEDPVLAAAGAFRERLRAGGIHIDGAFGKKSTKDLSGKKALMAEIGKPIANLIVPLNKNSDNYIAENIFKLVGSTCSDEKSNWVSSRHYLTRMLDSLKTPFQGCDINDGSGLSRRNRVTSDSEIELLIHAKKSSFYSLFDSSLSIAGVDGTLRNRMINSYARGNLHAKTGTHGNVSALAGYVRTRSGELLAFSFIFNGGSVGTYKDIENRLGALLASIEE